MMVVLDKVDKTSKRIKYDLTEDNEDYNESIVEEDIVIRSSINDPFEE